MFNIPPNLDKEISELTTKLSDSSKLSSQELGDLSRQYHKLSRLKELHEQHTDLSSQLRDLEAMVNEELEPELLELTDQEITSVTEQLARITSELEKMTRQPLTDDDKSCIIEIRSGTGGVEASLFAEDLYRMYTRYCNKQKYPIEVDEIQHNAEGGIKSVIFRINEEESFGELRFESGVHRVQRVPTTESAGRIHTSAASVAVLPQVDNIEVVIKESELKIDVYRSSGPGGQSVNTTDSAVRVTHMPTGLVVTCQDGKSQLKNKEKALNILAARLYDMQLQEILSEQSAQRSSQIKSGDRSVKIRTYNFPQSRVTDHRVKKTWHSLESILGGDLSEVIQEVQVFMRR